MDEAAVPEGPTGRNVLVQGLETAENGDPSSCSSGRRNVKVPVFRRFQALDKDVSPWGLLGWQHHPCGMWAPSQFQPVYCVDL
eukprot:8688475-Alexandrium_andersonii.AAC.1